MSVTPATHPTTIPTVRSLARALNLSPTTVSEALRGIPRVKPATQHLVRAAAEAFSYRPNPLASAVMSEMRRSRRALFRGMLAATTLDETERPPVARRFFSGIIAGATARANDLGFGLETFLVGQRGVRLPRLDTILQSRGIRGLILLPAWDTPDFSKLDWSRYVGVYTDYIIERPALHAICSDHYRSMMTTLQRLHEMGYRRPGLFLRRHQDERLQHRWEGAFLAFQQHAAGVEAVPPLVREPIDRDSFVSWFLHYKPDIVLGHEPQARTWMRECGVEIPRDHGFFNLNLSGETESCAGLDLHPELIGARAAEIVIGELHRNEFGIPEHPSLTTLVARWVDGPTIRATSAAGA
jgi:DNA-binding LacI/PurR family transcriptional regulator